MSRGKIWKSTIFTLAFKKALEIYGLKQKDIAEKIEMPTGRVSEYATGKTDPTIENVNKIAAALGLSISDFFALAENDPPHGKAPPPAIVPPPQPSGLALERENELLRQIAGMVSTITDMVSERGMLASELLAKDAKLATVIEALRLKDLELVEKDGIIKQLVELLKEAGLEDIIPPALLLRAEGMKMTGGKW